MTATAASLPKRVPFLDERAKVRATGAVRAFETHTSAELVVTVKREARRYLEVDLACGAALAFATLNYLLFSPKTFATSMMPVDVAVAFLLGFFLPRAAPPLRRLLLPRRVRRGAVDEAALAAFVRLGVSRTTGRTGVLVFVSLFERMVSIVPDAGVTQEAAEAARAARGVLEAAVARSDVAAFAEALESLGPRFGATMKRAADDVNELPDEVA